MIIKHYLIAHLKMKYNFPIVKFKTKRTKKTGKEPQFEWAIPKFKHIKNYTPSLT